MGMRQEGQGRLPSLLTAEHGDLPQPHSLTPGPGLVLAASGISHQRLCVLSNGSMALCSSGAGLSGQSLEHCVLRVFANHSPAL